MPVYDPRIVEELAAGRWRARTPLVHAFWGPGAARFELHLLFHRLPAPAQCVRQVLLRVHLGETAAGPFAFDVRASLFDFQANEVGTGPLAVGSSAGPLALRPGAVATADVTRLYRRWVGNESRHSADPDGFAVVLKAVAIPSQGRASVWIRGGYGPTLQWEAQC